MRATSWPESCKPRRPKSKPKPTGKMGPARARQPEMEVGIGQFKPISTDWPSHTEKELDVQIKLAGKAREKFKQIEAQGKARIPQPGAGPAQRAPSKWDKKTDGASAAEVVNRRAVDDTNDSGEEEEEFDVKNLMNKFKNIAELGTGKERERNLDELEALRVEAKNLREQFEKTNQMESAEMSEEKRRQLEEEFKQLKGFL